MLNPVGQSCLILVLEIYYPACFPDIPALLDADYLDQA